MKREIIILIIALFAILSCEKEISIDLNKSNPQYVIEGIITDQPGPYTVKISKSVNFSDDNNYPAMQAAKVVISDNAGNSELLSEVSAGKYQTQNLQGVPGRIYSLSVTIENKKFTAICQMPLLVTLDSVSFMESSGPPMPGNTEKLFTMIPRFNDPASVQNNYRFIQWANNEKDKSFLIINDDNINGKLNKQPLMSMSFKIRKGDVVTIEMHNIDKQVYDYFSTLNQIKGKGPGGGGTPANPQSNISGDVMGYFSAHTVQTKTITIK